MSHINLPPTEGSEHDRFQRFATAILGVPKSEIATTVTAAMKQKAPRTLKPEEPINPHRSADIGE